MVSATGTVTFSQKSLRNFACFSRSCLPACIVYFIIRSSSEKWKVTQICVHIIFLSHPFFSAKHEPQPLFVPHDRVGAGFQQLFWNKADQHSKVKAIKITEQTGKNIAWWILISCSSALITVLILTGTASQHTDHSCFLFFIFYCIWLVSVLLCPEQNHPLETELSQIFFSQ